MFTLKSLLSESVMGEVIVTSLLTLVHFHMSLPIEGIVIYSNLFES